MFESRTPLNVALDEAPLRSDREIVLARQMVRRLTQELGFSLVDQTKMDTAASELARNALVYGGGGSMKWELLDSGGRRGLKLTFSDEGPGIADVEIAMTDGWTSRKGLGLGPAGARRVGNHVV